MPYNSGVGEAHSEVGRGGLQTGILTILPGRWVFPLLHLLQASAHPM